MKKQIIIALATLTALPAVSQEKWDLRKCIDYAIEHNLSIKQQVLAVFRQATSGDYSINTSEQIGRAHV